ncbi:MAG: hypothetical protein GXY76_11110 [Chloroflexi bacterium]|nr:hypothetical protein [Chloroflexota bacterium]
MSEIEKQGSFYLGKEYDLVKSAIKDKIVEYDARDLTTHAICVGMTGSGKTGLCTLLLEEAALDGIPSILIDPKGDITNLCLTFPNLLPADFEPWVNVDDARRKGMSIPDYAARTARSWAEGLAQWGQGPERIRQLQAAADFTIYTPGSDAGMPVSILDSMRAPTLSWDEESEALREKVSSVVSALLGLIGINADPLQSREHILLSNLFEDSWRRGEDLDVARLIQQIQKPPIRKLGVFDVDTFFPEKERFALAMRFNNILAAPSFKNWIEGQPLDIERILYTPEGKPRVSIFYIAHLDDAQRMFFVTLLMEQVISWMRAQSGTTSLRALVYFDELYGYFPPYPANPPSKAPIMTMLKQARAFGVGMMLTTQNPMDLDYKGLTNAGTWFIGKLQTDRDKARLLDGMEGALSEGGGSLDRRTLDQLISSLDSRVFIMHNVHQQGPQVFMTRWAMSYLRGPLTRQQIKQLMSAKGAAPVAQAAAAKAASAAAAGPAAPAAPEGLAATLPQMDPGISQYFLAANQSVDQALKQETGQRAFGFTPKQAQLVYEPHVLSWATVDFQDKTRNVYTQNRFGYLAEMPSDLSLMSWDQYQVDISRDDLDERPADEALFADLPAGLGQARTLTALGKALGDYIYREKALELPWNPKLKLYAQVDESEEAFAGRCKEAAQKQREAQADKIKASYDTKIDRIQDQIKREERELAQDEADHAARKRDEALNIGESVLNLVMGRRSSRVVSSASTKRRLTAQAAADVKESEETIAELTEELAKLKQQMLDDLAALDIETAELIDARESFVIKPRRTDVKIELMGIGWVPRWVVTGTDGRNRPSELTVSAFRGL